jgi:hypothetical protein
MRFGRSVAVSAFALVTVLLAAPGARASDPPGTTSVSLNSDELTPLAGGGFAVPPMYAPTPGHTIVSSAPMSALTPAVTATLTSSTGRYNAVAPARIVDTRFGVGLPRKFAANETQAFAVPGVPAGTTAVVINVTMAEAAGPGYLTAWPGGEARPTASAINIDRSDQVVANLVTVQVGAGATVQVFASVGTHVIVDLAGYYTPASSATVGRYVSTAAQRVLDTRSPGGAKAGKLVAGETVVLPVGTIAALPADAIAVVVKMTVTDALGRGFWTMYPDGSGQPNVSNVNANAVGETISNQVIVALGSGRVRIFAERGGHVIVDVVGYYTGASAPPGTDGLFTPVSPGRVLDTRAGLARMGPRRTAEVAVAGQAAIPTSGVASIVLNLTVTAAVNGGYLSVWPARTYRPGVSSLNASAAGQTIAGHVITAVSPNGFNVFTEVGGHVIADVAGWFVGTPAASVTPPAVPLYAPTGPSGAGAESFKLLSFRASGASPVSAHWNACASVRYRINLNGYDPSNRQVIEESFDRLSSAMGINFVFAGDSTYMPRVNDEFEYDLAVANDRAAPYDILVALGSEAVTDVVGGGIVGVTYVTNGLGTSARRLIAATVTIDMGDLSSNPWTPPATSADRAGLGPVVLHELAHAVGLGHVETDRSQLMYPAVTPNVTFANGDQRGLWVNGAQAGCN